MNSQSPAKTFIIGLLLLVSYADIIYERKEIGKRIVWRRYLCENFRISCAAYGLDVLQIFDYILKAYICLCNSSAIHFVKLRSLH